MKTKTIHYRCDEKYYKAIQLRADKQIPKVGVSTLVSRIVSFFGEIESVNPWFWDELKEEARKRKVTMASLLTEHTQAALKPKKDDRANWTYSPSTDQI